MPEELETDKTIIENAYRELADAILERNPGIDLGRVRAAFEAADRAHSGQRRKQGIPYVTHCIAAAQICAEIGLDEECIVAALLHDCIEDTSLTHEDIAKQFGVTVADIVEGVTKLTRVQYSTTEEQQMENLRKMFMAMSKDIRVILIKIADRLHNMRTMEYMASHKQIEKSTETMEIYAPIAHRLGMQKLKSELEDISLSYLDPVGYKMIEDRLSNFSITSTDFFDSILQRISDRLKEQNMKFHLEYRVKHIFSIYRKLFTQNKTFEEIFDILALRIITETELNCYEILGIIHSTYKPVLGRFKDYIAMPKPNMYQSLHTCILSGDGNTFEVQIRTKKMDEIAESGVAAHWAYKEGTNYNPKKEQQEIEEQLHWLRDFVNMSEDNQNAKEYVEALSHDIFQANVYVFTPAGKVIELPTGATPIDFIYKIHTGLAEKAVGAMVNNVMVPLNTELKTGDICEIKTNDKSAGPNEGWLNIATTNFAKSHIRKFLAKKNSEFLKQDKIQKGKESVIESFKQIGIGESDAQRYVDNAELWKHFGIDNLDEFYIAIVNKNPTAGAVIDYLNLKKSDDSVKLGKVRKNDDGSPVYVTNAGDIAITLGNCCTPIPGDPIIGYITKGKGITVHRKDCPNIANEKRRLIEVFWKENLSTSTYPVDLKIECYERANLVVDIMAVLSQKKIVITSLNAVLHAQQNTSTISVTIYVQNADVLQDIMNNLLNVKNVYEVTRATH